MEILILGGTGSMGVPLVKLLAKDHKLFVTTRSQKENTGNITYRFTLNHLIAKILDDYGLDGLTEVLDFIQSETE